MSYYRCYNFGNKVNTFHFLCWVINISKLRFLLSTNKENNPLALTLATRKIHFENTFPLLNGVCGGKLGGIHSPRLSNLMGNDRAGNFPIDIESSVFCLVP